LSVLEKDLNPDVKIGISLPMDHINGSGFFPGTSTTLTQTGSNIRNLLLTNKGERVGQPEFGCGLLQVLFEPMSDDLLESVRSEIEESIAFWLPHVTINNISVERDEAEPHQLNILIEFALAIQPTVHEVITLNFLVGE
jgi:phage baseplate assembly protein W|tara:strand:- start:262 stop:678 length:417 start_codon:yes stop_codon:yes gene_type:complete